MDTEIRIFGSKVLGEDRVRNIGQMYDKICIKYSQDEGNLEHAKVFEGRRSTKIYNPDTCRSTSSDIEAIGEEAHGVDTIGHLEYFINKNKGDSNFIPTVLHNHRNATTFSLDDLWQLLAINELEEIFIDTGDEIRILSKTWRNPLDESEIDDIYKRLVDIHNQVSDSHKAELDVALANKQVNPNDYSLVDVVSSIYDEARKIAYTEVGVVKATGLNGRTFPVNVGIIKKKEFAKFKS